MIQCFDFIKSSFLWKMILDALTSDKLRHKACAVPTKLDINNASIFYNRYYKWQTVSQNIFRQLLMSKHVSLENAYLKIGCR
jgi:hypothetical protein